MWLEFVNIPFRGFCLKALPFPVTSKRKTQKWSCPASDAVADLVKRDLWLEKRLFVP